jgi:hypothetical protein
MTDKELLELAAKAAGIVGRWDEEADCFVPRDGPIFWNPLTDDGDALRLAVKLGIRIDFQGSSVKADDHVCTALDVYAATRRAIVRAAAEIGKTK